MTIRTLAAFSAATLALAACGPKNQNPSAETNAAMSDALNEATAAPALSAGQSFANGAAASDSFEIGSSKLAIANSSSAAIKSFAQKMIDAHTGSTAKLKAAAAQATPPITPDPTLSAEQQAKLDALKAKTGSDFDHGYMDAQIAGHQAALALLNSYAGTGDVPSLTSFASALVPTVTAHLNMAKGLKP